MSTIKQNVGIADTPSDSDVDRRAVEALDEAEAILGRFVNPATLAPRSQIELHNIAVEKAQAAGLDAGDVDDLNLAFRSIQNVLKERCVAELTRLDRVVLDLSDEYGSQAWRAPLPSIAFCAVRSGDGTLQRHAPEGVAKVRALAVFFDAELAGTRFWTAKDGTKMTKPDVYDARGYIAIVGVYGSVADAEQAKEDLSRAVRQIAVDISHTAEEDDALAALLLEDQPRPHQALRSL